MTDLRREQAVRDVVARIAHTIDGRQWSELRTLYADHVDTDYTSLFGGEVQRQTGDGLIAAWRRMLSPLSATQHLLGPIDVRITGDRATADCHVRGYHVLEGARGGSEWMVAGHWLIELVDSAGTWAITRMALRTLYQSGNKELLQIAAR